MRGRRKRLPPGAPAAVGCRHDPLGRVSRLSEPAHLNAKQWIAAFAERLGVAPPTTEEFKQLLDVAGVAAHSSERVAAPVACWVAARAGVEPAEALRVARELSGDG